MSNCIFDARAIALRVAFVLAVLLSGTATFASTSARAATASERPSLSLDRSDRALSDGEWDELQAALRLNSTSAAPAQFTQTSAATILTDPAPVNSDECGRSVAMGDANGDGRADALVGCDGNSTFKGNALLFLKNAGAGFTYDSTITDPAPVNNDQCGFSVAMGDVNGDGRSDAVVGCQGDTFNQGNVLVFTKNAGVGFTWDSTLAAPVPAGGDLCGRSVAVGDMNKDGLGDVLVGCHGFNGQRGKGMLFTRNVAGGFAFDSAIVDPAGLAFDFCASGIAVGDVNGDGRDDAILGCYGDTGNKGNAVVFTKNVGVGFTYDSTIVDPAGVANDYCGWGVALGDVNQDGRADAMLSCFNDNGGRGDAVLFTRNAGVGFTYNSAIVDPNAAVGDACGSYLAMGDTNADGRADVLLACNGDNGGRGNALIFTKNAGVGFTFESTLTDPAPVANDYCGWGAALGDVDADGRADALVGCYGDSTAKGNALVFNSVRPDTLTDPAPVAGDKCGTAVAVGDVNLDGRADVLVGCSGDNGVRGNALVFTKNVGAGFTWYSTLTDPAPAANDSCGYSVAFGDVNADGRVDAIVGCYGDTGNQGNALVFTKNVGAGFSWDSTLVDPAPVAGDRCGRMVSAGDVNADGRADVVVGCDSDNGGIGNALVFTRNAGAGFSYDSTLTDPTPVAGDSCGVAGAVGDMNADGLGDILIGCQGDNGGRGNALAFTRNAGAGFTYDSTLTDPGPVANDHCGFAVALGDVNADGRADALIGCYGDTGNQGNSLVFTKNAGVGFTYDSTLTDPAPVANDNCGDSVVLADVNGDGRADAVVGCQGNAAFTGNVLVFTKNAGAGFTYEVTLTDSAAVANDWCGFWVGAGDTNADGRSDVVVGCNGDTGNKGNVIVFPSTTAGRFRGIDPVDAGVLTDPAAVANDKCGASVAFGDVNLDGRADALVGCYGDNGGRGNALLFTKNVGTGFTYDSTLTDPAAVANDFCGVSVALADTNGDGRADALIGCYGDNGGAGNALLFTKNAGVGFTYDSTLTDPAAVAGDACGLAVALGDTNLDGRADALIGCYGDASFAGNALLFTKNAGVGFTYDSTLTDPSPVADDQCGRSLAFRDVNADGRADALIGCNMDNGFKGNVLMFIKNAGVGFTWDSTLTDPAPVANDSCGMSVALGDVNADGRADALIGCWGDNGNRGNALVFLKNAGAGFTYESTLTDPAAAAGDNCGFSVALGDINADGRADALIGCLGDTGGQGNALVFLRNTGAGFSYDSTLTDSAPVAGDNCGFSVALGDVNSDGRADELVACRGDNGSRGNVLVNSDASGQRVVRTLRVNQISALISAATVTVQKVDNGGSVSLEASADGGTNWEAITSGVAHSFIATGSDLRVRATLVDNPWAEFTTTPVLHDMQVDYTYNSVPDVPVLTLPLAGGSTTDTTPDLVATFSDTDVADTGMIGYEVCTAAFTAVQTCAGAGGVLLASGSSPAGIVTGASGTWTVTPSLIPQTLYWRARATDNGALTSAWSASWQLTIIETLTINVDNATVNLGVASPGTDTLGTTIVTITSNDPQGYTLSATDEDDAWGINAPSGTIPDWIGTGAAPTFWAAATSGASGYFGITVRDTTGATTNRLPKWGTANPAGWPQADLANNYYAGLKLGTGSVLHDTTAAAPTDTITTSYRIDPSATTPAGNYDATIIYTVVGKL